MRNGCLQFRKDRSQDIAGIAVFKVDREFHTPGVSGFPESKSSLSRKRKGSEDRNYLSPDPGWCENEKCHTAPCIMYFKKSDD